MRGSVQGGVGCHLPGPGGCDPGWGHSPCCLPLPETCLKSARPGLRVVAHEAGPWERRRSPWRWRPRLVSVRRRHGSHHVRRRGLSSVRRRWSSASRNCSGSASSPWRVVGGGRHDERVRSARPWSSWSPPTRCAAGWRRSPPCSSAPPNELGEFESGLAARFLRPVGAAVFGGVGALIATGAWAKLFPALRKADRLE